MFPGRDGGASDQGSLRRRVLVPAAERAGLTGVGFHTLRHTCASMLIESGLSPLRLQRWMGHHSPAFTLETYGHLIDGDLGPGTRPPQGAAAGPAMIEAGRGECHWSRNGAAARLPPAPRKRELSVGPPSRPA